MDKNSCDTFLLLENLHYKVSTLFKGVINERNKYKFATEELNLKLENLLGENAKLRKENDSLSQKMEELKTIISSLLKKVKTSEHQDSLFDLLNKEPTNEKSPVNSILRNSKLDVMANEISASESCNDYRIDLENDRQTGANFSKKLFSSNEDANFEEKKMKGFPAFDGSETELCENKSLATDMDVDGSALYKNASFTRGSPVFKSSFSGKKSDIVICQEIVDNCNKSSLKLGTDQFLFKSVDQLLISPSKKKENKSPKRGASTPKRFRNALKIKSTGSRLDTSNINEALSLDSGSKKFMQMLLNVDVFKKISSHLPERKNGTENKAVSSCASNEIQCKLFRQPAVELDDADVICGSPKHETNKFLTSKNGKISNNAKLETAKSSGSAGTYSPQILSENDDDDDMDETYISTADVKRCKLGRTEFEVAGSPPLKRSPYSNGPYRGVKKKSERRQMPGHTCAECKKYYKEVFADEDKGQNFKELLNKCSRHRNNHSPSLDETLPGYWKPFLTATPGTLSP